MSRLDAFLRFFGLLANANQKGNKGRGAAKRRIRLLGFCLVILVVILALVHVLMPSSAVAPRNLGTNVMRHAKQLRGQVADFALDHGPRRHHDKRFQHPPHRHGGYQQPKQHNHHAATDDGETNNGQYHEDGRRWASDLTEQEQMELVLSGKLNLIDIRIDQRELRRSPKGYYDGIYGIFCALNFDVHKKDPASVPMFRDIVSHSPLCNDDSTDDGENEIHVADDIPRGQIELNLRDLADMARESDSLHQFSEAHNLNLGGVVFHESRCGSTLVANSLIAMNPTKHRVYSESAPPLAALTLCANSNGIGDEGDNNADGDDNRPCTEEQGAQIVRDVIYFMGRTDQPSEERFFFKIQSAGSKAISVFRKAFPNTPWIFVYRDPVQVMMSHFAHGEKSANCLRSKQRPPKLLQTLAKRRGYKTAHTNSLSLKEMSSQEFCAAHLATLTETAAHHLTESHGLGRPVNYVQLPHILYEKVLPSWGIEVSQEEIENIKTISGTYSKARNAGNKEWQEDSEKKEKMASPEIQEASKIFLSDSFNQLEEMNK